MQCVTDWGLAVWFSDLHHLNNPLDGVYNRADGVGKAADSGQIGGLPTDEILRDTLNDVRAATHRRLDRYQIGVAGCALRNRLSHRLEITPGQIDPRALRARVGAELPIVVHLRALGRSFDISTVYARRLPEGIGSEPALVVLDQCLLAAVERGDQGNLEQRIVPRRTTNEGTILLGAVDGDEVIGHKLRELVHAAQTGRVALADDFHKRAVEERELAVASADHSVEIVEIGLV